MKKLFLAASAIAAIVSAIPAIAQRQIQMPPKEDFIFFLRRDLASDPATARFKMTDQSLLGAGKLWCQLINRDLSLNDLYQLVASDPELGRSPASIKLHRAIINSALWSLCSEAQAKIRNPDTRRL